MDRTTSFRGPVIAGVSYLVVALASAEAARLVGTAPLIWLPGGAAIAALYLTPERRWPATLLGLAIGQLTGLLLLGSSLGAGIGFTAANIVEAVICAAVGVRLFDGRVAVSNQLASLGSLFVVAVLGASASALIALPFRGEASAYHFMNGLVAHVVGILSATPILLYLHDRFWRPKGGRYLEMMLSRPRLPLSLLGLFALSLAVLFWLPGPLLLLPGLAIVIAVLRYGQLAASAGVLTYAAAAMIALGSGAGPAALGGMTPDAAALILQVSMLLILVTSLPLASLLQTYDHLQALLKQQNSELNESLQVLTMAEKLVGMGRWRLELRSGRQHWSPAMLEMNGLDPALGSDPGDVTALLPDGGAALFAALSKHRHARVPYSIDYTIVPENGAEQFLRMVVSNEFDEDGKRIAIFGVTLDVTMQVHRERALQVARQHALDLAVEARKLALTDSLTGLANRRHVFEELTRLAQSCPQRGEQLTLVLFDIDHFKRVNDTHGHQTGDAVLQRIADLARRQVRSDDLVGRIGGEEFVWLLPGVDSSRARDLAERLRQTIERESAQGNLPKVTVSLGMALLRRGDTPEQLIARADEALYRAKESGRNCVQRAA